MRRGVQCRSGKSPLSEREAWRVAHRFITAGDEDCHAYHCAKCSYWHVGFNRQSRRRRMAANA